jgi:hypothetical protein
VERGRRYRGEYRRCDTVVTEADEAVADRGRFSFSFSVDFGYGVEGGRCGGGARKQIVDAVAQPMGSP